MFCTLCHEQSVYLVLLGGRCCQRAVELALSWSVGSGRFCLLRRIAANDTHIQRNVCVTDEEDGGRKKKETGAN